MKKNLCVWMCLFIVGATVSAAQRESGGSGSGERFIGTWEGSWEGAGSGGIELILEKGKEGAVAGRVSVTGEPSYKTTFRTLSFEDGRMNATYDFPGDAAMEIQLVGTFDDKAVTGTWLARANSSGDEVAKGTWTAKKK